MNEQRAIQRQVSLETLGEIANQSAAKNLLEDYQSRLSDETTRRQQRDIQLFETYLYEAGHSASNMYSDVRKWYGVSWGIVSGFVKWMEQEGYATDSINVRLATIKAYCRIAAKAEIIDGHQLALIQEVKGYRAKEAHHIDKKRVKNGTPTRKPHAKKEQPTEITPEQAALLKNQPDTEIGRRDSLLMCILLDLGLRCGEIVDIKIGNFALYALPQTGMLKFYRSKVSKIQTFQLSLDTRIALERYLEIIPEEQKKTPNAPLFAGVQHANPNVIDITIPLQQRAINKRVKRLGEAIGIHQLSPHDCRHALITWLLKNNADLRSLQDLGGWSNPAMVLKYATEANIANEKVELPPGWSLYNKTREN